MIKNLIYNGVNINMMDNMYETTIMIAAKGNDLDGINILADEKIDLSKQIY